MKYFILELIGVAFADTLAADCVKGQACWMMAEQVRTSQWKSCASDQDCTTDHYCLQHMAQYKDAELESGQGCWPKGVCTGSGTFQIGTGIIQWFCADDQFAANESTAPVDWGLIPVTDKQFESFSIVCDTIDVNITH